MTLIDRIVKIEEDRRKLYLELMEQVGISCPDLVQCLRKPINYIVRSLTSEITLMVRGLDDVVALDSTICFPYSLVDPQVPESIHQRTQFPDNVLIVSMTPMVAKRIS